MGFWKKRETEELLAAGLGTSASSTSVAIDEPAGEPLIEAAGVPAVKQSLPIREPLSGSTVFTGPGQELDRRFGKLRSALSEGTVIQGKLSFDTPVRIDGKLTGQVFSTDALIVGPKGSVNAEIEVSALIVLGRVQGKITVRDRLEIAAGGSVEGEIATPVLVLEEGGMLDGSCKIIEREAQDTPITGDAVPVAATADPSFSEDTEDTSDEARVH